VLLAMLAFLIATSVALTASKAMPLAVLPIACDRSKVKPVLSVMISGVMVLVPMKTP